MLFMFEIVTEEGMDRVKVWYTIVDVQKSKTLTEYDPCSGEKERDRVLQHN